MDKLRIYRLGLSQMSNLMEPRNPIFWKILISQGAKKSVWKNMISQGAKKPRNPIDFF